MSKTEKTLSIFVASPGDVSNERDSVTSFVEEWNNVWSDELGIYLKLLKWETHAYPSIGAYSQDVINNQIGEEYDFFLGIMGNRLGTPTKHAASGTVEEFERALARYRKNGEPQLLLYFKDPIAGPAEETTQVGAVHQFRKKLQKEGILYWNFPDSEKFSQLARIHLTRHVQRWAKQNRDISNDTEIVQTNLKSRYDDYVKNVSEQSAFISKKIAMYAEAHLKYINGNARRAATLRKMSDEQITPDYMNRTLMDMVEAMQSYADETEQFEASFSDAFSLFIESVLGAAAISIASPKIQTKSLGRVLSDLGRKLTPIDKNIRLFASQLARTGVNGIIPIPIQRSIAALEKFREHAKFGARMLGESEKLFDTKKRW